MCKYLKFCTGWLNFFVALGKSDTFKFITGSADRSVRCWKVIFKL